MKAIEMLQPYWEQLGKLFTYVRYCAGADMATAECRDFWLWTVYAAVGLGLLIVFIIGKKALKEQIEFHRNRKRLEAQRITADAEEMMRAVSREGAVAEAEISQEDLAAQIGQALKARVLEEAPDPIAKPEGDSITSPLRELAAIMLTDMVGYTESMERDEQRTFSKLLEHNRIVRAAISDCRGREIKTIGDGFLVLFRSAINAVDCAVSIQRALKAGNLGKDDLDTILIRIGVHLGEVIITANDVFGDGVNIAARIEPLAEAGGICISGEVFAQVHKKIDLKFERLEGVQLKNITIAPDIYRILLQ